MGVFEMIVAVVLITTVGSVLGHYLHKKGDGDAAGDWDDWGLGMGQDHYPKKELKPYLDRIDALEERVRVLERIVTDPANKLSREIDDLNDPK